MQRPWFSWSRRTEQAEWLRPRLDTLGSNRVGAVAPRGFEAYARLLHPAESAQNETLRWADIAAWSGVELNRGTQFHDIALPQHTPANPAPWDTGTPPTDGTLIADDATVLIEALRRHTTTLEDCWFCLWDGYGWDNGAIYLRLEDGTTTPGPHPHPQPPPDPVPASVRAGPRVWLPGRDYLLYTGAIEAALAFVPDKQQTPNLWWPADQAWCVATDLDLIETYVAGSRPLIDEILAHPNLEALPAHPDDTIAPHLRGWLADMVESAVAELLDSGRATLTTSRGTAHASLRRPTPSQRGELAITYGLDSTYGTSRSWFEHTDEEQLRQRARFALNGAVIHLAEG